MNSNFRGKIRRAYKLEGRQVLVIEEGYVGELEVGDWLELILPSGKAERAPVINVAWGSALRAESPPLTVIVSNKDGTALDECTEVRGVLGDDAADADAKPSGD